MPGLSIERQLIHGGSIPVNNVVEVLDSIVHVNCLYLADLFIPPGDIVHRFAVSAYASSDVGTCEGNNGATQRGTRYLAGAGPS